jgi:hypothetical protein
MVSVRDRAVQVSILLNLVHWIVGAVVVAQSTGAKGLSPPLWDYALTDTVLHAVFFACLSFAHVEKRELVVCGLASDALSECTVLIYRNVAGVT